MAALRQILSTFRDAVKAHQAAINLMNVYPVPDGDTGTNMARTLDAAVAELDGVADDDLAGTLHAVSHGSLMGARGNSGVILSQILRGFAGVVQAAGEATAGSVAAGLQAAASAAYSAVLKPIEGTPPDLFAPPAGCAYFARCPSAMRLCETERPPRFDVAPHHYARCWLHHPARRQGPGSAR